MSCPLEPPPHPISLVLQKFSFGAQTMEIRNTICWPQALNVDSIFIDEDYATNAWSFTRSSIAIQ
jgi:hypothetical protein